MARVHFEPYSAIKYVGPKTKEFSTSLARPKPQLKKGDIVIVDKKNAHNFVNKGFAEFIYVEKIEFAKNDIETHEQLQELESANEALVAENEALKAELAKALELVLGDENLEETKQDGNLDETKQEETLEEQKEQGE